MSSTVELLKEVTALKAIGRKPHPNVMSMLGLSFMEGKHPLNVAVGQPIFVAYLGGYYLFDVPMLH